ncbi:MAG: OsmC family protein [Candidatus Promineifilaceae bacterium]|nr:OsmC family protein [Candidatus Promineifilaceae bacterium]
MAVRSAEAVWEGTLRQGAGRMKMASGAYEGQYSFSSRFEEGAGTNPEELIAAAHAGCFSMALAGGLERAGFDPQQVETTAQVHLTRGESGFRISRIHLETEAEVPGIDQETLQEHAEQAKEGCPVSQALGGVDEITVDARLVG